MRNSTDFIQRSRNWTIKREQKIVSFDVTSLLTNVPTDRAIQVAKSRLEADNGLNERTNLTVAEVLSLLKFCLNATYFIFQNHIYTQKYGTAMGSPVSVTVANLVMEDVEERAMEIYHTRIPVWKR